jgi:hypothetical protein
MIESSTQRCIEKLANACYGLPGIEPDGTSECPFAEEVYFRKEEAAFELKQKLKSLYEWEKSYQNEIARGESRFREGAISSLQNTRDSIAAAKKALAIADKRKFPREPIGPFGRRVGEPLPSTQELLSNDRIMKRFMEGE